MNSASRLEAIEGLYRASRFAECARACIEAIDEPIEDEDEWYTARILLAGATSKLEGTEAFGWFVEPAIEAMLECAGRLDDERRGHSLMTAGHLAEHRTDGDADARRTEAIDLYRRALAAMESGRHPSWALTQVSLGIALLEPARALSRAEIEAYEKEVERAKACAREAIGCFEAAMRFYEAEDDAENRQDAAEWLARAHDIADRLDLRKDPVQ